MAEKRVNTADRIAQLQAKLEKLQQQQATADRKADARRKIILGGAIIAHMNDSPEFAQVVTGILKTRVTKPKDQEAVQQWLSTASPQGSSPAAVGTAAPPPPPTGQVNA